MPPVQYLDHRHTHIRTLTLILCNIDICQLVVGLQTYRLIFSGIDANAMQLRGHLDLSGCTATELQRELSIVSMLLYILHMLISLRFEPASVQGFANDTGFFS